jgi:DNA topoisomerase I
VTGTARMSGSGTAPGPAGARRAASRSERPAATGDDGKRQIRYVSDREPGYLRVIEGDDVRYEDAEGRAISDPDELRRIRSLAIPPAWTDVWICSDPDGHLQAVGRDARGRKQYRYHPDWRRARDEDKYGRMLRFARRLPRIREAVERDLARPGMPRERVLALIVRLLELTHMRVGNEEYAKLNRSYGLTTLRDRHAQVEGTHVRFRFRGKGGRQHEVGIRDRRLARLVRRIQELPGQHLFEYADDDGSRRPIRSDDVNAYLRSIAGTDVSAKDFRTWAGTVLAFRALHAEPSTGRQALARRRLKGAIDQVAERLGNTATVCRTSYVDPVVVQAWEDGALERVRRVLAEEGEPVGPPTQEEEAAVLRLLQRRRRAERQAARSAAGAQPVLLQPASPAVRAAARQSSRRTSRPAPPAGSSGKRSRSRTSTTPDTDATRSRM